LFVAFAGKKQPNQVGKSQKQKNFNSEVMTTFKTKFWQNSQVSSLGVFDVSVSKF